MLFRGLLETIDPAWDSRAPEERREIVDWFSSTSVAISRQYFLRDPCHDASDVLQDILVKLFTKFSPADAPHRLLTEKPCMRKLMGWRAMDRVDWENAEKRSARRKTSLSEAGTRLVDRRLPAPDRAAEIADEERRFRREIRDPVERKAYLLFRTGLPPREVARMLRLPVAEAVRIRDALADALAGRLGDRG